MEAEKETLRVLSRFRSETGEDMSSVLDLPVDATVDTLQLICNALLKQVSCRYTTYRIASSCILYLCEGSVYDVLVWEPEGMLT
jgi:hypothetical protein